MDFFTEYIIKQKKSPKVILAAVGMVLLTLIVWYLSLFLIANPMFSGIAGLLDAGMVYFTYVVITNFNIEYEYIATNTDLDIDKITNRRKRKRVASLRLNEIEIMAPVGYAEFKNEENGTFKNVYMAAICENHPDAYYIIYEKNGERNKLVFNPTDKIIEYAKRIVPRKVYTKA
ncbi:MAG: hypothetical protein IJ460_04875 [Clostridia bacterium]|nr:hypothetical protein [Clostridia bacterium]